MLAEVGVEVGTKAMIEIRTDLRENMKDNKVEVGAGVEVEAIVETMITGMQDNRLGGRQGMIGELKVERRIISVEVITDRQIRRRIGIMMHQQIRIRSEEDLWHQRANHFPKGLFIEVNLIGSQKLQTNHLLSNMLNGVPKGYHLCSYIFNE